MGTKYELERVISSSLSGNPEIKKDNWYIQRDNFVILINLQKSDYSDCYYLNLGICFGAEKYPQINKCDIRWRVDDYSTGSEIDKNLDFEDRSASLKEKLNNVSFFIQSVINPIIDSLDSVKDIRNFLNSSPKKIAVTLKAKEMLK